MSSVASITVSGMDDLQRKLESLGGNYKEAFEKAGLKAMRLNVESGAKEKCPVDTGNLRGSLNTQVDQESIVPAVKTGTTVEYGPDVEFGTSRQRDQPFLRPAFDEGKDQVVADVRSDLEAEIKQRTKT